MRSRHKRPRRGPAARPVRRAESRRVGHDYAVLFLGEPGNPVALLGEAFATEELGASNGADVAKLLVADYGIPRGATNFLRVHGSVDVEHVHAAARAIALHAGGRAQMAEIVQAVKMTYRYYSQLFTDVLELGDRWTKDMSAAA